jgi:hypothetical protein
MTKCYRLIETTVFFCLTALEAVIRMATFFSKSDNIDWLDSGILWYRFSSWLCPHMEEREKKTERERERDHERSYSGLLITF